MAGVLYECQSSSTQPVFIRAVRRKCTKYECNYHSSKSELIGIHFAFEKYEHFLLQVVFQLHTDNTTVVQWETMMDLGGTIHHWFTKFSYLNFRIEH